MPRTLKRRADAISRDDASSSEPEAEAEPPSPPRSTQQQSTATQRRPRRPSTPRSPTSSPNPSLSDPDHDTTDPASHSRTLIKKLVRLALSTEYARQPLRRTDITAKILKSDTGSTSSRVNFRTVFVGAQKVLREVFGMELVDLPVRERVGLSDRRKAVSQKATQALTQRTRDGEMGGNVDGETQTQGQGRRKDPVLSAQNWILYRARPELMVPSRAPDQVVESAYVALYTVIVGLMYLHTPSGRAEDQKQKEGQGQEQSQVKESAEDSTESISDAKLHRYLSRLNLSEWAPLGIEGANVEKLLARMMREGYIEKRRDTSGGEEVVEWVAGPRGKKEVGRRGVAGLVRGVYGFGVDGSGKGLEMPRADGEEEEADGQQQTRRRPVKMEKDELESRLKRTLGDVVALKVQDQNGVVEPEAELDGEQDERPEGTRRGNRDAEGRSAPRRSGRRRHNEDDDDE
ncbi:hypothetical protein LTR70_004375 [Exophiala xenobiotica]|uniref:MAGE domain-containing protein n=1 Tax=Lithohypha guttulata TaxID=1690604 RepID=A0ABR0KJB0_9EURO|nr:hypothetical protein LTR24_001952 [Lithohypha guttulata]KAK5320965.1 hypothetical protein LTR70_004375 [Exophiala xenobiotica]